MSLFWIDNTEMCISEVISTTIWYWDRGMVQTDNPSAKKVGEELKAILYNIVNWGSVLAPWNQQYHKQENNKI